jgi:hypothetical protein
MIYSRSNIHFPICIQCSQHADSRHAVHQYSILCTLFNVYLYNIQSYTVQHISIMCGLIDRCPSVDVLDVLDVLDVHWMSSPGCPICPHCHQQSNHSNVTLTACGLPHQQWTPASPIIVNKYISSRLTTEVAKRLFLIIITL